MSVTHRALGLFGGTYDPIHVGHLRAALEVRLRLGLEEVRLLPWRSHSLREKPAVGGELRADMVRAAVRGLEGFVVDERAFWREPPVYTVDVMSEIRKENPDASLCMISGMDAFSRMEKWYRWEALFDVVHIVVVTRPGAREPQSGRVAEVISERRARDPGQLRETRAGSILVLPVTAVDVSGTALRESIAAGLDPRFLVPEPVREIILRTGAYAR